MNCYYKRFTSVLTKGVSQNSESFYKANNGTAFNAFANPEKQIQGFARDLFIDVIRWSYFKGSITYLNPRSIGLKQFWESNAVFVDLLKDYRDQVFLTYTNTKGFLEQYFKTV